MGVWEPKVGIRRSRERGWPGERGSPGPGGQGRGASGPNRGTRGFGRGSGNVGRGRGNQAGAGGPSGGQGRGGNTYDKAGWGRNTSWRGGTGNTRGRGNQTTRGRGTGRQSIAQIPNDASTVDYNFQGQLTGPERFSKSFREFKFCQICNVSINSSITAQSHYAGKPHMKKMKEAQRKEGKFISYTLSF